MRIRALATDYDETLAHYGRVNDSTLIALEKLRDSGRRLILVTGRQFEDLRAVCPRLDLFDRIIAENGAVLYDSRTGGVPVPLAEPPPRSFVQALRKKKVEPLSAGQVIVATTLPHQTLVAGLISEMNLPLEIILNKGAVMVLPRGIDKAFGLRRALEELDISSRQVCAVGDAENDISFLREAGFPAAVANALPRVREISSFVSRLSAGLGVEELIERLLSDPD